MYSSICREFYLPALDALRRMPYAAAMREATANQWLDPVALRRLQADRLRGILIHARTHSPYYRELMRACNFAPEAVREIEDLRALPILEKDDVRRCADRMRSPVFPGRLFSASTSGSTGKSLRFFFDSEHAAWVQACVTRGRTWWELSRGEKHLLLLGHPIGAAPDTEFKIRLKHRLRNCIEFDTFQDLDSARAHEILAAIRRFHPKVIYGYGSGIGRLARQLLGEGIRLAAEERPVLVEYTADHMFDHERQAAAEVFGAPVISFYGARECGGMAPMCPQGRHHWSADHALCEIVRPDGSPAAPGEVGDLVVTPFDNFAMPFVRYRLGDRLAIEADRCSCGISLPVVRLEAGRASEIITTSERCGVSSVVFDFINRIDLVNAGIRGIRQFLVEQIALDHFILHVVRDEPFDPRSVEIFVAKTKLALGVAVRVDVSYAQDIPMESTGKRRWFKKSMAEIISTALEMQPERVSEGV